MARQQDGDTLRLKRERAGRYVTADGRYAVEGDAAGAWYVIDSGRLDGLGLPLVRGPYPTLDAARDILSEASQPATTEPSKAPDAPALPPKVREASVAAPKPERPKAKAISRGPQPVEAAPASPATRDAAPPAGSEPTKAPPRLRALESPAAPKVQAAAARTAAAPSAEQEPAWLARLSPQQRAEARRLVALLERAGIDDPALARREIEADLPEVARALLANAVQREAQDPWADGTAAVEALAATDRASPRGRGAARTRAAKAAVRRLLDRADADDLALLAWLVAVQTSVRVFKTVSSEGRDAGQGLRGWRLVELGGGRAPTGRSLLIDESDLSDR